jgi:hypothetical protein
MTKTRRKVALKKKAAPEVSISALSKARTRYAERGDAASCGDWLALALKTTVTPKTALRSASSRTCLRKMESHGTSTGKLTVGLEGFV